MSLSGHDPLLSVIVPSYNSEAYLQDLLGSIYGGITSLGVMTGQTLQPDEVIIIDDCSTDNTKGIVEKFQRTFDNLVYLRLENNSGTAVACNEGIKIAKGKFITRIDSDDMRESKSFEIMMKAQLENLHSYIYDDITIFLNGARREKVWKMHEYDFEKLLTYNTNHAGIMAPKEAFIECGGYPENFRNGRDDWAINVSFGIHGYCGVHVDYAGYLYRREGQNRTVKNSSSENQKRYFELMKETFESIYQGRRPMGCCGNRKNSSTVQLVTQYNSTLVGAEGMTLLFYNGDNFGSEVYFGPVTGTAYKFSKSKPIRNVDVRDLHSPKRNGLLDLQEFGKPVFSVYEAKEEKSVDSNIPVKDFDANAKASEEIVAIPEPSKESGQSIVAGDINGIGAKSISKLNDAGISTWEQFVLESSESLSAILGKPLSAIDKIKKELTE